MRLWLALLVAVVGCAGCVTMDAAECRGANWFDIGYRDGLRGLQRTDVIYENQCSKHGVALDVAEYRKGWQNGNWVYEHRADSD